MTDDPWLQSHFTEVAQEQHDEEEEGEEVDNSHIRVHGMLFLYFNFHSLVFQVNILNMMQMKESLSLSYQMTGTPFGLVKSPILMMMKFISGIIIIRNLVKMLYGILIIVLEVVVTWT